MSMVTVKSQTVSFELPIDHMVRLNLVSRDEWMRVKIQATTSTI